MSEYKHSGVAESERIATGTILSSEYNAVKRTITGGNFIAGNNDGALIAINAAGGYLPWRVDVTYTQNDMRRDEANGSIYRASRNTAAGRARPSENSGDWALYADMNAEYPTWFRATCRAEEWGVTAARGSKCRHSNKNWVTELPYNENTPGQTGSGWTEII